MASLVDIKVRCQLTLRKSHVITKVIHFLYLMNLTIFIFTKDRKSPSLWLISVIEMRNHCSSHSTQRDNSQQKPESFQQTHKGVQAMGTGVRLCCFVDCIPNEKYVLLKRGRAHSQQTQNLCQLFVQVQVQVTLFVPAGRVGTQSWVIRPANSLQHRNYRQPTDKQQQALIIIIIIKKQTKKLTCLLEWWLLEQSCLEIFSFNISGPLTFIRREETESRSSR